MDKTKKIIGRRLTAQHLEYQKIAENVEYKPVSRNKLSKLAYRYTPSTRAIDLRLFIIRYYELKEKVDKKLKRIAY